MRKMKTGLETIVTKVIKYKIKSCKVKNNCKRMGCTIFDIILPLDFLNLCQMLGINLLSAVIEDSLFQVTVQPDKS